MKIIQTLAKTTNILIEKIIIHTAPKLLKFKIYILHRKLYSKRQNINGYYLSSSDTIFITILTCRILLESRQYLPRDIYYLREKILDLVKKSLPHIKREARGNTWNYWSKDSLEYLNRPLPDDLDDSLNAHLVLSDPDIHTDYFDAKILYDITNSLINTESTYKGGVHYGYNTWINSPLKDIDPIVQIIVYKLLFRLKSVPVKFHNFLVDRLKNTSVKFWESKYYHSKLHIINEQSSILECLDPTTNEYTEVRESLVLSYRSLSDEPTQSPFFNLLLRIDTELSLHIFNEKNMYSCFFNILKVSLFPIFKIKDEPIFIESIYEGTKTYCRSKSIVIALYIKTLTNIIKKIYKLRSNIRGTNVSQNKNYAFIIKELSQKIQPFISTPFHIFVKEVFKGSDALHITHTELHAFSQGIRISIKNKIFNNILRRNTEEKINLVYFAMLLGWISYTIYDSIRDKELSTEYISIANICNTYMSYILFTDPISTCLPKFIQENIQQKIVEQNLSYDKDQIFSSLQSSKSIGHSIGPICLLSILIPSIKSTDIENLEKYYSNHLSLKQLSADVHDWQEDMEAQRKTYVTELIRSQTITRNIDNSSEEDYIETFTTLSIYTIYQEMKKQTAEALYHLNKISLYVKPLYLESRIKETQKYVTGIKQAINEIELYNLHCYTSPIQK